MAIPVTVEITEATGLPGERSGVGAGAEAAASAKGTAITSTVTKASVQGVKRLMRKP